MKSGTLLSRADDAILATAIAMCITLKALIHEKPELLPDLINYLYDAKVDEVTELPALLDEVFALGEKRCFELATTYVEEHPLYSMEEDAPSSRLDADEYTSGTMVYRVYRDVLFMYVSKIWKVINKHTVLTDVTPSGISGVKTSLMSLDLASLKELEL